jgi:plastocyanin
MEVHMTKVLRSLFIVSFLTLSLAQVALAQTNHDVTMHIDPVEGRPVPVFYFQPVGLHIQPGDTVTFIASSPHHTATAYHAEHVKSHRVPEGVEPFGSPIVPIGQSWSYTFTVPGTYDLWCGPHEHYGMAMRIVVGEPGGPAEESVTNFGPDGVFAVAGVLLNLPELASSRIVELGAVPWADVLEQVLAAGLP